MSAWDPHAVSRPTQTFHPMQSQCNWLCWQCNQCLPRCCTARPAAARRPEHNRQEANKKLRGPNPPDIPECLHCSRQAVARAPGGKVHGCGACQREGRLPPALDDARHCHALQADVPLHHYVFVGLAGRAEGPGGMQGLRSEPREGTGTQAWYMPARMPVGAQGNGDPGQLSRHAICCPRPTLPPRRLACHCAASCIWLPWRPPRSETMRNPKLR